MQPAPFNPKLQTKLSHYSNLQTMTDRVGEVETPISDDFRLFLCRVMDETTWDFPQIIRAKCPIEGCHCQQISTFLNGPDVLMWGCERCGENGVITDWKDFQRTYTMTGTDSQAALGQRWMPRGWLLVYSLIWLALGLHLGYRVVQEFSYTRLLQSMGFLIVGGLLWTRNHWALTANVMLSCYVVVLGARAMRVSGNPQLLIGGICLLASNWAFRDELEKSS